MDDVFNGGDWRGHFYSDRLALSHALDQEQVSFMTRVERIRNGLHSSRQNALILLHHFLNSLSLSQTENQAC